MLRDLMANTVAHNQAGGNIPLFDEVKDVFSARSARGPQ